MSTLSSGISTNKYLYNGKEYQDDFELRWYDYGLRFYDPALARWHSVDHAAELMFSWSPYNYCFGNPIRYKDKDGAIPLETIWDIGNVLYDIGSGIYHEVAGNREAANSAWGDLGMDAAAMLIPYVPAGASKVIKGAKAVDKAVDAAKTVDKATDAAKAADKATDGTKTYQTYTKKAKDPSKHGDYSGRTSGKGRPEDNVAKRDNNHHMNDTHGPAKLDKSSTNPDAIRGREQQLIDKKGGAQSQGGTSGNKINGVGPNNKKASQYKKAAEDEFGKF